jgi:hypothetical protein
VRPKTAAELATVKGIGAKKAEQYGSELFEIMGTVTAPTKPAPLRTNTPTEVAARATGPAAIPIAAPSIAPVAAPTAASPPSPTIPRTAPAQASINQLFLEEAAAEDSTLDQPAESSAPPAATKVPAPTAQPSHYWTWRLLSQGFSPAEVAAIRSLSDDVVLDHALRAADSGSKIDAGWFLSSERIAAIRAVLGPNPPSRIRPLLDKLPRGTRYEDVQLVIKSPASGDSGSRA